MSKSSRRGSFGSFRGKVANNASKQRSKAANYGHLLLPRGINIFKEDPGGRAAIDILPYFVKDQNHTDRDDPSETAVAGSLWYRRPYKLHRQVGLSNTTAVCPSSFGRKCPICEYRDKLVKEDKIDWQDKRVKILRPSERNLYYVIPKGDKKFDDKPHLWDISGFCFQELLIAEFSENEEFEVFPGLEDGLTLRVRFSEEKTPDGRNTFAKASRIDFLERDYKYDVKIVQDLTSLDEVLDVKDYKTLENLFFETEADADEIVEDDDNSTPPDDDDEDQVDDDIEEDDEPQDTHRRRTDVVATSRPRSADGGSATVTAMTRPDRTAELERIAEPSRNQDEDPNLPKRTREAAPEPKKSVALPLSKKAVAVDTCPYGYKFGVDVDSKDECEECPSATWSACMDAHNEAA